MAKTLSSFYEGSFGEYLVPYQGEEIIINDFQLGDLARMKATSEDALTNFTGNLALHQVKGIIGDLLRYYTQLVKEQRKEVQKAEANAYVRFKGWTLGQVLTNSSRNANDNSKSPTDKVILQILTRPLDGTTPNAEQERFLPLIQAYKEQVEALGELEAILARLENSFNIVCDTFKVAISLNANERLYAKASGPFVT